MCALGAVTLGVALATAAVAATEPPAVLDLRVVRGDQTKALRDVLGRDPTLVVFWATYCAPCRAEVPGLNRAADRWRARGLRVVGVALDEDAARVREAHDEWGMAYETLVVAPGQGDAVERALPRGVPASAFVARGAATLHEDYLDDAALEKLVPPLLDATARGQ